MWQKIKGVWKWLEGKKRRIAMITALAANYVDDPTIKPILLGLSILLGGADVVQATKAIKKNKPKETD